MSPALEPSPLPRPLVLIDATNALNPQIVGGKRPIEHFKRGLMALFPGAVVKFYVQLNETNGGYIAAVRHHGFDVITDVKNLDVKLTIDGVTLLELGHFNPLVLITMDGDFVHLVNFAKELGKRVYVIAHQCEMLSSDLQAAADHFVELLQLYDGSDSHIRTDGMELKEVCVDAYSP